MSVAVIDSNTVFNEACIWTAFAGDEMRTIA